MADIEKSYSVIGEAMDAHVNVTTRKVYLSRWKNIRYLAMTEEEARQFYDEFRKVIEILDGDAD